MDLEEQRLPEQSPSAQAAEMTIESMGNKSKKKKWKLAVCILLVAAALALLFAVWIYPAILHRQMQGKWYQKVIEGEKSTLLMLSIDEDTVGYYLCVEPNVLLGDTDALPITSPNSYSVKPFGKVEIRFGTASYEQSKYDVFIWGDSMKMAPGFGGMGEEWSRYSNKAYYFPETSSADWESPSSASVDTESVSSFAVASSKPAVSSAVSSTVTKTDQAKYDDAVTYFERENYGKAYTIFKSIEEYGDSKDYLTKCKYEIAQDKAEVGNLNEAIKMLSEIPDFKDASKKIELYQKLEPLQGTWKQDQEFIFTHYIFTGCTVTHVFNLDSYSREERFSNDAVLNDDGTIGQEIYGGSFRLEGDRLIVSNENREDEIFYKVK